jgi:hypothetical protein
MKCVFATHPMWFSDVIEEIKLTYKTGAKTNSCGCVNERVSGLITPFDGGKRVFYISKPSATAIDAPGVEQIAMYGLSTGNQGRACKGNPGG